MGRDLSETHCPDCDGLGTLEAADWSAPEFTGDGHGFFCNACGFQIAANDERKVGRMLHALVSLAAADRKLEAMQ